MAYADIPENVLSKLSSERMRMYHAMWHFVRNEQAWRGLSQEQRSGLVAQGWEAPRFEHTTGGGIDFLYMHRRMIEMVNIWGAEDATGGHHHHSDSPPSFRVIPWLEIPLDHNDIVWPMPPVQVDDNPEFQAIFGRSKDIDVTEHYRTRIQAEFGNRSWLRSITLDDLGTELERSIHGWMHMHWSPEPPPNPNSLDITNDWLGSPFSSHVNKHFWRLHGWIDNRILAWSDANGVDPDLSEGWEGPIDRVTSEMHSADPKLFNEIGFGEMPVLTMLWDDLLLEN